MLPTCVAQNRDTGGHSVITIDTTAWLSVSDVVKCLFPALHAKYLGEIWAHVTDIQLI